ncbi:hypothetical protein [Ekhidna sp.]
MKKINWADHLMGFFSVILGVSLAFIISNESERAKEKKDFQLNVVAILEEVESDIHTFESYQIPDNKEKLALMQEAIQLLTLKKGGDSLSEKMAVFFDINNYAPTNITINSLISSGKLDLISDFELKKKILSYQNSSEELVAQGDFQVSFLMDQVIPWFVSKSEYFTGEKSIGEQGGDENSDAIMIFSLYTAFIQSKVSKYEAALEDAKELESMLRKYQLDK